MPGEPLLETIKNLTFGNIRNVGRILLRRFLICRSIDINNVITSFLRIAFSIHYSRKASVSIVPLNAKYCQV